MTELQGCGRLLSLESPEIPDRSWYWVRFDGIDGWTPWTPAQRQGNHWNSVSFRGIPMREVEVGRELERPAESLLDSSQAPERIFKELSQEMVYAAMKEAVSQGLLPKVAQGENDYLRMHNQIYAILKVALAAS